VNGVSESYLLDVVGPGLVLLSRDSEGRCAFIRYLE